MKLALIFPAWCDEFGTYTKVAKKASSFPPLNLCIVGALAEQAGWEVCLIDAEVEQLDVSEVLRRIQAFQPDMIGMTATTPFFHRIVSLGKSLKQVVDASIIVGGQHVSIVRQDAMEDCFDYLMIGECELVFKDFLARFSEGERAIDVPGVMYRQGDEIKFVGPAPVVSDLDETPSPARHLLRNDLYFIGTLKGRKRYTSVQMSRGCPFRCVYCANDLYGRRVRRHRLERVLEEIDLIVNGQGIRHIYFIDDTLTLDRKFIFQLCEQIEKREMRFTFEGSTRANLWDEEIARRLKACGLIRISFGLETAVPEILRLIKKDVPLEAYVQANKINNRLGIETINSVMLGLPGDTPETIRKTVDFLCKARDIHHTTYGIAMPYPGTELRAMAERGENGLQLIEKNYSQLQRYGSAVMEVNGMSPEDLIQLQKEGLRRIYSCWWRIIPMIRRHGLSSIIPPAWEALKDRVREVCNRG